MTDYAKLFNPSVTPQSEPITGSAQVPNSAGGYAWALDDWGRLQRWLILGSDSATYYASAPKLTRENAEAVLRCVTADPARAVEVIASVSESGRAPKNDPAVFALALAASLGGEPRRLSFAALGRVCRIGTHLFHFMRDYEALRSAGHKGGVKATGRYSRSVRRALAAWYQRDADDVAWQVVKYAPSTPTTRAPYSVITCSICRSRASSGATRTAGWRRSRRATSGSGGRGDAPPRL